MNSSPREFSNLCTRLVLLSSVSVIALVSQPARAQAVEWVLGDVFAGVSNGTYQVYDNNGVLKETISNGVPGSNTTGCAFNPALDKLYTTDFTNANVPVFDNADPHAVLQTIDAAAQGGAGTESIVFDTAGNFYVGNADGNRDILKYNAPGNFLQAFDVATGPRGSDWVELSSDQNTIFYTSEGGLIRRYDVSTGTQLADFANIGGVSYALRLLPPGDGSGGLIVSHNVDIVRLNATGAVVQTYDAPGEDTWFAMNRDPNGTSFWAGDYTTNNFYRFNIATGAVEVGPVPADGNLFGLCVKGEPTAAAGKKGKMTGEGKQRCQAKGGARNEHNKQCRQVEYEFKLNCEIDNKKKTTNGLDVAWDGNEFELKGLTAATCLDDPKISEGKPVAGFDTYQGLGTGRYNGIPGATAEWTFTDAGEPGNNDTAKILIKDDHGNVVLSTSGKIKGNNQALPPGDDVK